MSSSAQFFSVVSNLSTTIAGSLPFRSASSSTNEPSRDLDRYHHAKVRPLLDAVDKLRGILAGTDTDIQLPSIVVVGDQSSGKSSVLESLADVNLPRGQNITTRVPLILRLVNLTPDDDKSSSGAANVAYATISAASLPEEKISLKDVSSKVDAFTKSLAGSNVGVTDKPITLTVYRPNSPEITLIDLPGIVRNPIGDQPKDIYQQIRKMIKTYIVPETSIILNVMPSTVDFPTCECITLSREVDPQLARSIAVVTKLDLSEKGISKKLRDAVDQLGLHLGVVCVKNRNHEENERGVTFDDARVNEMKFFEQHKELSVFLEMQQMNLNGAMHEAKLSDGKHANIIPRGRILIGTPQLAQLLASIQEKHVRNVLPRVETKIRQLLNDTRVEYKALPPACTSPSEARFRFDQMLLGFVTRASALCKGDHSTAPSNEKLHISARLYGLYFDFLQEMARVSSVFLSRDYAEVIQREMRENAGVTLSTFQSPQVFHGLWLNELAKFRTIIFKLIETVRSLHSSLLLTLCKDTFGAFPPLHQVVSVHCSRFIDSCYRIVLDRVEELLAQEEDVFTMNGYYEDTSKKLNDLLQSKLREGKNSNTSIQVNDLTLHLNLAEFAATNIQVSTMQVYMLVYNTIAQKRIADNLIKAFRFHFTRAIYSTPQLNKNIWMANTNNPSQATPSASTPTNSASSALSAAASSASSSFSVSSLSTVGLLSVLQKECQQYSDNQMLEFFKELPELNERREKIKTKLSKLEKSMQVMEAVR